MRIEKLRSGDDSRKNWLAVNGLIDEVERTRIALTTLLRKVDGGGNITMDAPRDGFHPFEIYQLPTSKRAVPDPTTDFRKVRVRSGWVEMRPRYLATGGVLDPINASNVLVPLTGTGSDGMPYGRADYAPADLVPYAQTDLLLTTDGIWFLYGQLSWDVSGGAGPTDLKVTLTATQIFDGIQNYQSELIRADRVPIGIVVWNDAGTGVKQFIQFARDHFVGRYLGACMSTGPWILGGTPQDPIYWGGLNIRGDYDATALYYPGDLVVYPAFSAAGPHRRYVCCVYNASGPPSGSSGWDSFGSAD